MSLNYSANDLKTLSPGRAYREKLGMYLSADKQEAIDLGLRELIYNAQDEYEVTKKKDAFVKISINTPTQEITVIDNMRGIPCAIRDDGINSLTAAFLIPHSGAKHRGEEVYSEVVGINGQGAKIVCHTAKWLKVEVHRDGNVYFQSFHETDEGAVPDEDVKVIGRAAANDTGTKITYVPSPEVYEGAKIDTDSLRKTLTTLAYFTKGLKIILEVDGKKEEFYSEHGLIDGLDTSKRAHKHPLSFYKEYPDCKVELALQWNKTPGTVRAYANNLYVRDGGAFMTGFKTSLTKVFNSLAKSNFTGEQIRKYLDGFVSVKVKEAQFSNQAKTALANPEARTATSSAINEALKDFFNFYPENFNAIVEILKREEKAEKAAERARKQVMEAVKDIERNQKKKVFSSDKLKDAEFLGQDSTLLICEGDSAMGAMAQARDYQKYGLMAIRGKIINCLAHTDEKIFENEEIKLLLSAMNITPGKYDSKKLRYGRLAICTDADSDGYHIGLLIMAALYYLAPQFIEEGRLCWLRSPLYIVSHGKKEEYFFTDEEYNAARGKIKGEIHRNKGLGELSATQARNSMFDPAVQRLDVIKPTNEALALLSELMGADGEPRTKFVFEKIDFSEVRE